MPTPPLFRFYLKPDDATWFVAGANGVSATATETPLDYAPDGWEDTEIKWGRNIDYRTLSRSFSTPYKFVKDGAKILRNVYFRQGSEGVCKLVIKKRRSFDLTYENYYTGDIDFSTISDDLTFCSCEIAESGLPARIKAYANTPEEVKLDGLDNIRVYSDGIKLRGAYNWLVQETSTPELNITTKIRVLTSHLLDEGDFPVVIAQTSSVTDSDNFWIIEAGQPVSLTIKLQQHIGYVNTTIAGTKTLLFVYAQVIDKDGAIVNTPSGSTATVLYQEPGTGTTSGTTTQLEIDVNVPILKPLEDGDRLFIYYTVQGYAGETSVRYLVSFGEGKLTATNIFRLPVSYSNSIRLSRLFGILAERVAGYPGAAQSTLLNSPNLKLWDNRPFWTVATCGDALRGLYGLDSATGKFLIPTIKTTLSEFLKMAFALYPVGMAVENGQFVLELLDYFFAKDTQVYDLGEVSELSYELMQDYAASSFKIGYENQTYDAINGRDEYNTSQTYKSPIIHTSNTSADFISPYRADPYGAEIYRANLSLKKTTDSSSDNDTFITSINETANADGSYGLYRPQNRPGGSMSGVYFPDTVYNVDLSPKRNLFRQGAWLKMMNYLQDGKKLTFQTTDKNPDVKADLGSGPIVENADVDISSLPPLPFLPIYLRCKKSANNINEVMAGYPKGYFRFTYKGQVFKGFLDSAGVKPAKMDQYQFQFLAHPDLDMLTLINACAQ